MFKQIFAGLFPALLAAGTAEADTGAARNWISATTGHAAEWQQIGTLPLPSGAIFVGDPSWGGDHHLRGALAVTASDLAVWLLRDREGGQNRAVWLEAAGTLPVQSAETIDFGVDSAYFAFGDRETGLALANIGDLELPGAPDSFEFFLPHIQREGFSHTRLEVPPTGAPVYAVNTGNDGGLRASWLRDAGGELSGILIDITGRASDRRHIDMLLTARP